MTRDSVAQGASGTTGAADKPLLLDDCLGTIVEEYLFGDLDSMTALEIKPVGAVCYPIMMAVLAGSELLGVLTGKGGSGVAHYWEEFMSRVEPTYGQLGELADVLLRNGLMHAYVTKPGVGIRRDDPDAHLTTDASGLHVFNCDVLAEHFKTSYRDHARAAIYADRARAQQRLDDRVMAHAAKQASTILASIPAGVFRTYVPGSTLTPSGTELRWSTPSQVP